jgi:hypothetical protein
LSLQDCFYWLADLVSTATGGVASDGMLYSLLEDVLTKLTGPEEGGVPPPLAEQLAEVVLFLCAKIHQYHGAVHLTKLQVRVVEWGVCMRGGVAVGVRVAAQRTMGQDVSLRVCVCGAGGGGLLVISCACVGQAWGVCGALGNV